MYISEEQGINLLSAVLKYCLYVQLACQYQNNSPSMAVPKSGMCIFESIAFFIVLYLMWYTFVHKIVAKYLYTDTRTLTARLHLVCFKHKHTAMLNMGLEANVKVQY